MKAILTHSAQETKKIGAKLAGLLKPDSVIGMTGNLGAGKTVFVKGMARGLGISENKILSPTFVIIRQYLSSKNKLFHFDFYRLGRISPEETDEVQEYFSRGGICVIEWADKIKPLLPKQHLLINIDTVSKNKRRLRFTARGRFYRQIIKEIEKGKSQKSKGKTTSQKLK